MKIGDLERPGDVRHRFIFLSIGDIEWNDEKTQIGDFRSSASV